MSETRLGLLLGARLLEDQAERVEKAAARIIKAKKPRSEPPEARGCIVADAYRDAALLLRTAAELEREP